MCRCFERSACARGRRAGGGTPVCLSAGMHEGRMATGAGEGGGHTALENTTATALTESSSSSSSSSVPTILAENNTSTNLPLPGPQQQTLHQVQQQQQTQQQQQQQQTHSRPPVNLVTDLPANDTSGNLNHSFLCSRVLCCRSIPLAKLSFSFSRYFAFSLRFTLTLCCFCLSLSLSLSTVYLSLRAYSLSSFPSILYSPTLVRCFPSLPLPFFSLLFACLYSFCPFFRSTRSTFEVTGTYDFALPHCAT